MESINNLKIGINNILGSFFPNVSISSEEINQGFEKPYFFVKVLNSYQNKELNRRYKKGVAFDIHYFSNKEDVNEDCNSMTDKLYEILEYVNIEDKIYRASGMHHEVVDGVLHFFLEFNYHVIKESETIPKMNSLNTEVGVKNG